LLSTSAPDLAQSGKQIGYPCNSRLGTFILSQQINIFTIHLWDFHDGQFTNFFNNAFKGFYKRGIIKNKLLMFHKKQKKYLYD
jgi:hypothetical protein